MSECNSQLLSAYADGELSADQRAQVDAHMLSCPKCAAELTQLRESSRSLSDFGFADITPAELQSIHDAVDRAADRPIWRIGGTLGVIAASILIISAAWLAQIPAHAPTLARKAAKPE